jgi:nitrogen fixation/metabolism regulation signal transduction histidine kinase
MLIAGLIPLFILLFLWGLILSHRFSGPLERVERDLDKILEGDASVRFKVREKDDIRGIVDKLNKLIERLKP